MLVLIVILGLAVSAGFASPQAKACATQVPPSEQLSELFEVVQLQDVFEDSKTFADLVPDEAPSAILIDYQLVKDEPGFNLGAFVHRHFSLPTEGPTVHPALPGEPLRTYIGRVWEVLRHQSDQGPDRSSLLPLPYPYVVPGGPVPITVRLFNGVAQLAELDGFAEHPAPVTLLLEGLVLSHWSRRVNELVQRLISAALGSSSFRRGRVPSNVQPDFSTI